MAWPKLSSLTLELNVARTCTLLGLPGPRKEVVGVCYYNCLVLFTMLQQLHVCFSHSLSSTYCKECT